AGEDDAGVHVSVVGKRQRSRRVVHAETTSAAGGSCFVNAADAYGGGRAAVPRAGGELERKQEIRPAGQRLCADLVELRDDVRGCEPLAVRPGEPAFEALGRQRLDVRACVARRLLRGRARGDDRERCDRNEHACLHPTLAIRAFVFGAMTSTSAAVLARWLRAPSRDSSSRETTGRPRRPT